MRASRAVAPEIVAAIEGLVRATDLDLAVIAAAAGLARSTVADWARVRGWARRQAVRLRSVDDILADLADLERRAGRSAMDASEEAADPPALTRRLRRHVGRQIAAFDAALCGEGAAVIDSARVLRDLGGLKRLLDDLAVTGQGDGKGDGKGGREGDGGTPEPLDLPVLRAEIARRYGILPGERPADGLSREPAGAADRGTGA